LFTEQNSNTTLRKEIELNEKVLLLADDDIITVSPMRRRLEARGFNVEVAYDAKQIIEQLLRLEKLDLLILDVMMPLAGAFDEPTEGLEAGLEILRRIRKNSPFERWRNLPVLSYTVRGAERRIREELESLGAHVIPKGDPVQFVVDKILEMTSNN